VLELSHCILFFYILIQTNLLIKSISLFLCKHYFLNIDIDNVEKEVFSMQINILILSHVLSVFINYRLTFINIFLNLLTFVLTVAKTKDGDILHELKNINEIIDLRAVCSIKLFTLVLLLNI